MQCTTKYSLKILVCMKAFSGDLVDHYPWHFQSTEICQYSEAEWACIIELRALSFHMLKAQLPSGIPVTLDGIQKMDRIGLCAVDWPWPIFWPTSSLNHMILFWSIKLRWMCQKMNPNSDCACFWKSSFSLSPEHHWLALYNLASLKLESTIPVKIVLIKTSIYPCIRACFNWFFLFELKNIIELIWITGCFASIHQRNPDNTCCCQGNMITDFVCFSTINYFNALTLVFTDKHTTVCRSHQYCN